jgi:hypothetical protein
MNADPAVERCVCGHEAAAHRHYRRGTECAICESGGCDRFSAADAPWWRSILTFVTAGRQRRPRP